MSDTTTPRLTRRQAAILGAYTGVNCEVMGISTIKELAEEVLRRRVYLHEFSDPDFRAELRKAVYPLLLNIVYDPAQDADRDAEADAGQEVTS